MMHPRKIVHILVAVIALAIFLPAENAIAQGFMVKPTLMDVSVQPGRTARLELELRNTTEADQVFELRLADLTQTSQGQWTIIESATESPREASAMPWTTLDANEFSIAAYETVTASVYVDVPRDARGYYFAALIAQSKPPENPHGISLTVRFVVPMILQIAGRPVRQDIDVEDLMLVYRNANETDGRPTTIANIQIANNGRTYSRVRGQLNVELEVDGRWRPVTKMQIDQRGIIPNMTLTLGGDLDRRLPSGTYRLRGEVYADGRRLPPLEKEIAFVGDPGVDIIAYDTALTLEPEMLAIQVAPGATRTTAVSIQNPGKESVEIRIEATTPPGLQGVAMGDLLGESLSAGPWIEIRPAEFTIRPGGRQNVRVMSKVPREHVDHPHYYADLVLHGTYADGQSAGETRSMVHLRNSAVESKTSAVIEGLSLAKTEGPSTYIVQANVVNIGNVHIDPALQVRLLAANGRPLKTENLGGEAGTLLPLGKRAFSGELNFVGLEPGYYALRATIGIEGGPAVGEQQMLLLETEEVRDETGATVLVPRVNILDPDVQTDPSTPGGDPTVEDEGDEKGAGRLLNSKETEG